MTTNTLSKAISDLSSEGFSLVHHPGGTKGPLCERCGERFLNARESNRVDSILEKEDQDLYLFFIRGEIQGSLERAVILTKSDLEIKTGRHGHANGLIKAPSILSGYWAFDLMSGKGDRNIDRPFVLGRPNDELQISPNRSTGLSESVLADYQTWRFFVRELRRRKRENENGFPQDWRVIFAPKNQSL